jgi:hypothetical protein
MRKTEVNTRCAIFHGMLAFCGYLALGSDAQWAQVRDLPGGRIRDYYSIDSECFLAVDGRIFHSENEGASWTPMASPGKSLEVYSIEEFDGTILAGTPAGVYQSPMNNESWELFDRPGLSDGQALSIWAYLGYLYIGSEGAVFKSIDQGKTWAELKSGLPQDARITCFAGIVKIAVAGSENRGIFITESTNWIPPPVFDSTNSDIRDLDVFGNKVYAVTPHEVLESANLGADWGPSSFTMTNITSLHGDDARLYAGTDHGVYFSTDKGKSWNSFNEGLPEKAAIRSLVGLGGSIFASTDRGVWRIAFPSPTRAGIPYLPSGAPLPPHRLLGPLAGITPPASDPMDIERVDFLGRWVRSLRYGNLGHRSRLDPQPQR